MLVTIVIPLYNKEEYIEKTLQTVWHQTFQDFEVVIIDDGSTDGGPAIIKAMGNPKIRLIHQENMGVSAARNRGIDEAKGELICFLDADDEWNPDYLQTQANLYRNYPMCNVFATGYQKKNRSGEKSQITFKHLKMEGISGVVDNYFQMASNSEYLMWTSAVMVKRQAVMEVKGFPTYLKAGEDMLLWAKLVAKYKVLAYNKNSCATFVDTPPRKGEASKSVQRKGGTEKYLEEIYKLREFYIDGDPQKRYVEDYYKESVMMCAVGTFESGECRLSRKLCFSMMKSNFKKMAFIYCLNLLPHELALRLFYELRAKLRK